jgi:hypothetical protein
MSDNARQSDPSNPSGDVGKALKVAFLAPDIVQAILEGHHAADLYQVPLSETHVGDS